MLYRQRIALLSEEQSASFPHALTSWSKQAQPRRSRGRESLSEEQQPKQPPLRCQIDRPLRKFWETVPRRNPGALDICQCECGAQTEMPKVRIACPWTGLSANCRPPGQLSIGTLTAKSLLEAFESPLQSALPPAFPLYAMGSSRALLQVHSSQMDRPYLPCSHSCEAWVWLKGLPQQGTL